MPKMGRSKLLQATLKFARSHVNTTAICNRICTHPCKQAVQEQNSSVQKFVRSLKCATSHGSSRIPSQRKFCVEDRLRDEQRLCGRLSIPQIFSTLLYGRRKLRRFARLSPGKENKVVCYRNRFFISFAEVLID